MKINDFWGDLTDISAKKEALASLERSQNKCTTDHRVKLPGA